MQTPALATLIVLSLNLLSFSLQPIHPSSYDAANAAAATGTAAAGQNQSAIKQLLAVRGEVVKKKVAGKGWLQLTVKPPKDYPEVMVMARENDLVGNAVSRSKDTGLLGLLSESEGADELITAAEIEEGDLVSVIYDPQAQNRALEIYIY